jgi:hypothetical protein
MAIVDPSGVYTCAKRLATRTTKKALATLGGVTVRSLRERGLILSRRFVVGQQFRERAAGECLGRNTQEPFRLVIEIVDAPPGVKE